MNQTAPDRHVAPRQNPGPPTVTTAAHATTVAGTSFAHRCSYLSRGRVELLLRLRVLCLVTPDSAETGNTPLLNGKRDGRREMSGVLGFEVQTQRPANQN